jgi:predicted metal-dependent hydrolase
MTITNSALAALIEEFRGRSLDAHYLAYFECFNRRLFFEAHEVLEELWLPRRTDPNGAFYKGLIQLAGAFVHLQKNRLRPAAALFKLAALNLNQYPAIHEKLDVAEVLKIIEEWLQRLESTRFESNPLAHSNPPIFSECHWARSDGRICSASQAWKLSSASIVSADPSARP